MVGANGPIDSEDPHRFMTFFTPLPRSLTRPVSVLVVIAWIASMAILVKRSYFDGGAANLATDLARYGSNAEWRGVYYRGEKIGFTVSQTIPRDDGFELQEDGRLQMSLLGASSAAARTARTGRRSGSSTCSARGRTARSGWTGPTSRT